jgi:hypothetical protein
MYPLDDGRISPLDESTVHDPATSRNDLSPSVYVWQEHACISKEEPLDPPKMIVPAEFSRSMVSSLAIINRHIRSA